MNQEANPILKKKPISPRGENQQVGELLPRLDSFFQRGVVRILFLGCVALKHTRAGAADPKATAHSQNLQAQCGVVPVWV